MNVDTENYNIYKEKLKQAGFVIDDKLNLILTETKDDKTNESFIMGKKDLNFHKLPIGDIIYFESYDHEILAHNKVGVFQIKESLKKLEEMLDENTFIRINISTIININHIEHITPIVGLKYKLLLSNKEKLFVGRTYYYKFKEKFGFRR